jgi:hypothetical protein
VEGGGFGVEGAFFFVECSLVFFFKKRKIHPTRGEPSAASFFFKKEKQRCGNSDEYAWYPTYLISHRS